jgi:integrase
MSGLAWWTNLTAQKANFLVRSNICGAQRNRPVPPMVFPSLAGTYLDMSNVRRLFKAICRRAGIEGFTPYHLRHTYASLMLMRGADPRYVQQQLGHESLSTTYRYYAHWIPKEARSSYADLIDLRGGKIEIPCPNTVSTVSAKSKGKSVSTLE